jgi:hypothetical protein
VKFPVCVGFGEYKKLLIQKHEWEFKVKIKIEVGWVRVIGGCDNDDAKVI